MPLHPYALRFSAAFALALGLAGTAARAQTVVPDLGFTGAATPLIVAENAGSAVLPLSIRNANATASTVQVVVAPLGTATAGADFTFAPTTQTLTFAPGSTAPVTLALPIADDPANPRLVQYLNNRSLTTGAGDQGPEGLVFVAAANSPTGSPLLILANEISSTVAVYQIGLRGVVTARRSGRPGPATLYCYPNPATPEAAVRLSRPVAGSLLDGLGRAVRQLPTATDRLDVRGLPAGLYLLRADDGATSRLVVR